MQTKFNRTAQTSLNTGFGDNASNYGGRFLNKNGNANISKVGLRWFEKYSWFHSMLSLTWLQFFLLMVLFFIGVNLAFAVIYYFFGNLSGIQSETKAQEFSEAFFFSAQTFTTVGYGRISPTGFLTSAISSFQALMGLLSFAVATGLMYGRFSQPRSYLKFSHNALIAPYKTIKAIMFRVAPYKNTTLTEAEVKITLALRVEENGKIVNRFYPLDLEFSKINALTLSWTIVHPITETSPLFSLGLDDIQGMKGEILVYLKAFDDMFSNVVVARTSYVASELIMDAKFLPMYHRDENNSATILDLQKINAYTSTAD